MRAFVRVWGLSLACLAACHEPPPPVSIRAVEPVRVGASFASPTVERSIEPCRSSPRFAVSPESPEPRRRYQVDELVFGPNPAAYDRSGRSPVRVPRRPDEDYTADPYEFHYEDVPGLEGVREATNDVLLLLRRGLDREVALQLADSEGAEIVGQIPSVGWYTLKLPTTTFEAAEAAVARLRVYPEVEIVAFAGEDDVARGRAALAAREARN
ncbi:MAG: hypothetical protein R3B99_33400 [Polyangiales bacterium]